MLSLLAAVALPAGITIGPASMSLPELARELTAKGMACDAAGSLSGRAAFVFLKDRSPEEVRKLLSEALDVAFEPKGGRMLMVFDTAAKERDRRLLTAYAKRAGETVREWQRERQRLFAGRDYETLTRWTQQRTAELQGNGRASQAEFRELIRVGMAIQPEQWAVARQATLPAALVRAISGKGSEWTTLGATGLTAAAFPDIDAESLSPAAAVEFRLKFEAEEGVFGVESFLMQGGQTRMQLGGNEGTAWIPLESEGVAATFKEMGADAGAYLAGMPHKSDLPEGEPLKRSWRHISKAMEGFGHEAVMELSPRFEDAPRPYLWQPAGPMTPKSVFTPVALQQFRGMRPESYLSPPDGGLPEMKMRAERRFPNRVVERDGVWLVMNPYRFLDRAQFISPVPFLRAERVLAEMPQDAPRDYGGNLMFTWEMAVRLYRAVRPETTLKGTQEAFNYRDVSLHEASLMEPIIPIVESLAPTVKKAFWAALATEGKASLNDGAGPIAVTAKPFPINGREGLFRIDAVRLDAEPYLNITAFMDGRGTLGR